MGIFIFVVVVWLVATVLVFMLNPILGWLWLLFFGFRLVVAFLTP